MFSHNKRDNLPIVNYCSFILTGIFSILYCAEKICEGEFIHRFFRLWSFSSDFPDEYFYNIYRSITTSYSLKTFRARD